MKTNIIDGRKKCVNAERTNQIQGLNPTRADIEATVGGDTERQIACKESHFRQFAASPGRPLLRCEPDGKIGVGIMQVTSGPSDNAFWNWRQNIAESLAILAQKRGGCIWVP